LGLGRGADISRGWGEMLATGEVGQRR